MQIENGGTEQMSPASVRLQNFKKPKTYSGISSIEFQTRSDGQFYHLVLHPGDEFHFSGAPDVYYQGLPIKEVYSEPYRTFLYFTNECDIEISWPGEHDKLYVRELKAGGEKS